MRYFFCASRIFCQCEFSLTFLSFPRYFYSLADTQWGSQGECALVRCLCAQVCIYSGMDTTPPYTVPPPTVASDATDLHSPEAAEALARAVSVIEALAGATSMPLMSPAAAKLFTSAAPAIAPVKAELPDVGAHSQRPSPALAAVGATTCG